MFDTRDNSRCVTVRATCWKEARDKGRKLLKISVGSVNAAKPVEGLVDHDYMPKTAIRKKQ